MPSSAEQSSALPVTVVIPAYNRAATIERAVASALNQTPQAPAEVIVVDDCSTDETAALAQRAGARVIRHETNRGCGESRNTAIGHGSQPWLAFLDSDDEWLPNHLHTLWPVRDGHVLLAGAALRCESGRTNRYVGPVRRAGLVVRSPAEIAALSVIAASGVLVRRDAAQAAGGFRRLEGLEPPVEDLDMWLRVLEQGTGYVSPVVSLLYYVHSQQVSADGLRTQAVRKELLRAYSERPWFTPHLLRDWDTSMAWDAARTAQREGDLKLAARHLVRIAADPARLRFLVGVLVTRWRERRRSLQFGRSGAPTLAVVGKSHDDVARGFPAFEMITPAGATTAARYVSLARHPASALLVNGLTGRAAARVLGMRAIRGRR